jgi:hypothetical protein
MPLAKRGSLFQLATPRFSPLPVDTVGTVFAEKRDSFFQKVLTTRTFRHSTKPAASWIPAREVHALVGKRAGAVAGESNPTDNQPVRAGASRKRE